jgi:hypothetical protein
MENSSLLFGTFWNCAFQILLVPGGLNPQMWNSGIWRSNCKETKTLTVMNSAWKGLKAAALKSTDKAAKGLGRDGPPHASG